MNLADRVVLTDKVQVRVSGEEKLRLARAAELAGRTVSDWARRVLLDHAVGPGEGGAVDGDDGRSGSRDDPQAKVRSGSARDEQAQVRVAPDAASPPTAWPKGTPLFARAGCSEKVPEGVRCARCKAIHKP